MIDFPYYDNPPEGYDYWFDEHNKSITKIWIRNKRPFLYNNNEPVSSVWGFVKKSKNGTHTYYAPINAKKPGKPVNIEDTSPFSAMQINYKGLESFFV